MNTVTKNLKYFRLQNHLTMREAARRIGVPETTYREWEYGRAIRGEPYPRIAEAFGISVATLFGEESGEMDLDKRLSRIRQDVEIIQTEIRKAKK